MTQHRLSERQERPLRLLLFPEAGRGPVTATLLPTKMTFDATPLALFRKNHKKIVAPCNAPVTTTFFRSKTRREISQEHQQSRLADAAATPFATKSVRNTSLAGKRHFQHDAAAY
jgi:hypothetical protein